MSALVDNELSDSERSALDAHLAVCAGCQAELEALESCRSTVQLCAEVDPPQHLRGAILAATTLSQAASECAAVEPLFSAYLDGELDVALRTEVWVHLQECSPCTRKLAALRQTIRLVASLPELEPARRVSAGRIAGARVAPVFAAGSLSAATLAIAAALAVAFLPSARRPHQTHVALPVTARLVAPGQPPAVPQRFAPAVRVAVRPSVVPPAPRSIVSAFSPPGAGARSSTFSSSIGPPSSAPLAWRGTAQSSTPHPASISGPRTSAMFNVAGARSDRAAVDIARAHVAVGSARPEFPSPAESSPVGLGSHFPMRHSGLAPATDDAPPVADGFLPPSHTGAVEVASASGSATVTPSAAPAPTVIVFKPLGNPDLTEGVWGQPVEQRNQTLADRANLFDRSYVRETRAMTVRPSGGAGYSVNGYPLVRAGAHWGVHF